MFSDSRSSSRHFDYLFTCLGVVAILGICYYQHNVEFTNIDKNHVNFKFCSTHLCTRNILDLLNSS